MQPCVFASHCLVLCSLLLLLFIAIVQAQESQTRNATGITSSSNNGTEKAKPVLAEGKLKTKPTIITEPPTTAAGAATTIPVKPDEDLTKDVADEEDDVTVAEKENNEKPVPKSQNDGGGSLGPSSIDMGDIPLNSHFFVYLLVFGALLAAVYLLFHNRKKVLGLLVEGRKRREPRRAGYRKVPTEAMETSGV